MTRSTQRGSTVGARPGDTWMNWARTQSCVPDAWERPTSEEQLADVVRRAAANGRTVRAVGSGHSYSSIACTDGHLVDLSGYDRVLDADPTTGIVTVQAGITLRRLSEELAIRGLAMEVLGDINHQSVAGALSTGTHGPGIRYPAPSARMLGCRIIAGDGAVIECSPERDPELWSAARVGLGALGILSTVTLQTVPAFRLHTIEEPMRMDRILADLDTLIDHNDHFGLFWFPGSDVALAKRSNRTDDAARPRGRASAWLNDVVVDNYLFGAACTAATRVPSLAREHRRRRRQQGPPRVGRPQRQGLRHAPARQGRRDGVLDPEGSVPRRLRCATPTRDPSRWTDHGPGRDPLDRGR